MTIPHTPRRHILTLLLIMVGILAVPIAGFSQTAGMKRRQDRRDDRTERTQERETKAVERRDDPIGVRGPQRREDRREIRTDRRKDRRERVY